MQNEKAARSWCAFFIFQFPLIINYSCSDTTARSGRSGDYGWPDRGVRATVVGYYRCGALFR